MSPFTASCAVSWSSASKNDDDDDDDVMLTREVELISLFSVFIELLFNEDAPACSFPLSTTLRRGGGRRARLFCSGDETKTVMQLLQSGQRSSKLPRACVKIVEHFRHWKWKKENCHHQVFTFWVVLLPSSIEVVVKQFFNVVRESRTFCGQNPKRFAVMLSITPKKGLVSSIF